MTAAEPGCQPSARSMRSSVRTVGVFCTSLSRTFASVLGLGKPRRAASCLVMRSCSSRVSTKCISRGTPLAGAVIDRTLPQLARYIGSIFIVADLCPTARLGSWHENTDDLVRNERDHGAVARGRCCGPYGSAAAVHHRGHGDRRVAPATSAPPSARTAPGLPTTADIAATSTAAVWQMGLRAGVGGAATT